VGRAAAEGGAVAGSAGGEEAQSGPLKVENMHFRVENHGYQVPASLGVNILFIGIRTLSV
jgi:hypothetical protein